MEWFDLKILPFWKWVDVLYPCPVFAALGDIIPSLLGGLHGYLWGVFLCAPHPSNCQCWGGEWTVQRGTQKGSYSLCVRSIHMQSFSTKKFVILKILCLFYKILCNFQVNLFCSYDFTNIHQSFLFFSMDTSSCNFWHFFFVLKKETKLHCLIEICSNSCIFPK